MRTCDLGLTWGGDLSGTRLLRACTRLFSASRHGAPSKSRANARPPAQTRAVNVNGSDSRCERERLRLALLRQQRAGEGRAPVGTALVAALVRS